MKPYLSLIIPLYNEEKRLKTTLDKIIDYLSSQKYSREIIAVNDGSFDTTLEILKEFGKRNQNIKIISYPKNFGKGYAIKKGILAAKGKYLLFTDADLSTPIEEIVKFLFFAEKGFEIVIGTRKNPKSKIVRRQPFLRETLGKGFTFLVNLFLVKNISDITCGFKLFEEKSGKYLFRKMKIFDWGFDAEILFLAQKYGFKIKEIPVIWTDRPETKVNLLRDIFKSLADLWKIRINDLLGKY